MRNYTDVSFSGITKEDAAKTGIGLAPFSPVEIAALIARQNDRTQYPYRCNQTTGDHPSNTARRLIPGVYGLRCEHCGYTQPWVYLPDTVPPPGLLLSEPSSYADGVYDWETITPRELLARLLKPLHEHTASFRLVLRRTGKNSRKYPFSSGRAMPYGTISGSYNEENGYSFATRVVREHIACHYREDQEAEWSYRAALNRARNEALHDLFIERVDKCRELAGEYPEGESVYNMLGTDARLAWYTRFLMYDRLRESPTEYHPATLVELKKRWREEEKDVSDTVFYNVGALLDATKLTPHILLQALSTPDKPLPSFICFSGVWEHFPWFHAPNSPTDYGGEVYPTRLAKSWEGESWFDPVVVITFLERCNTRHVEDAARRTLLDYLKTPEGKAYVIEAEEYRRGIKKIGDD